MKPLFTPAELLSFVEGKQPMVLLHMPGCHEVCVNRAHYEVLGLNLPQVTTPKEYEQAVTGFIHRWRDSPRFDEVECYCHPDKANHIIALRHLDCVFDQSVNRLASHESTFGLGFRFHSQNGVRVYDVLNVHSQRLELEGMTFLLCTFFLIEGLQAIAKTEETGRIVVTIKRDGSEWLPSDSFPVAEHSEYADFDRLLREALAMLADANQSAGQVTAYVTQKVEESPWEYSPANPLAKSTFALRRTRADGSGYEISKQQMRESVLKVHQRLHDAPAVTSYAEEIVDRFGKELKSLYRSFFLEDLQRLDPKLEFRSANTVDVKKDPLTLRQEVFQRNLAEYRRLLPGLAAKHAGEFVALVDGKAVDFDKDELKLMGRTAAKYSAERVLIHPVKPGYHWTVRSPSARISTLK